MRIEKLTPSTHVQHFKDAVSTQLLPLMRKHLTIELTPHVTCGPDELAAILTRCTDVFHGMQSSGMEHSKLISQPDFQLILPRKRFLGMHTETAGDGTVQVCFRPAAA